MSQRSLLVLAMICAPAMLVGILLTQGSENSLITGIVSFLFMFGSLCTQLVLWQIAASGRGIWGRIAQGFQIVLVFFGMLFGIFEASQLLHDENILFVITDISWPLSMVWMLILGITIAIRGTLKGYARFAPMICGLAFPATIVLAGLTQSPMNSGFIPFVFFGMLAVFWFLMALTLRSSLETDDSHEMHTIRAEQAS